MNPSSERIVPSICSRAISKPSFMPGFEMRFSLLRSSEDEIGRESAGNGGEVYEEDTTNVRGVRLETQWQG